MGRGENTDLLIGERKMLIGLADLRITGVKCLLENADCKS